MKNFLFLSTLILCCLNITFAQNAKNDIIISGKSRVNRIMPLGKFRLWVTLTNHSKSDYKDIEYKAEFIAPDGTVEGNIKLAYHDFIGQGLSKSIKEQYLDCPKDCIKIKLSIVGGKKLG